MVVKNLEPRSVILRSNFEVVPNVYALKRVGAGADGRVFRYGDKVLKILKYDINERKEKGLMTFDKAVYFQEELDLKRIVAPIDILLDKDGVYTGYVMDYLDDVTSPKKIGTPIYKLPSDFTCGQLIYSSSELEEDFSQLTEKKILARDLNRGSYIFTSDFMHLCDMDKYRMDCSRPGDLNKSALNFIIAKFLFYQMLKTGDYNKEQVKILNNWVKKSSNDRAFVRKLNEELKNDYRTSIGDFVEHKAKILLR